MVDFLAANVAVRLLIYKLNERAASVWQEFEPNDSVVGAVFNGTFYSS